MQYAPKFVRDAVSDARDYVGRNIKYGLLLPVPASVAARAIFG